MAAGEVDTGYYEATERYRVEGIALSHLSIEVGHFQMTDFVHEDDRVAEHFRRVVPLVRTFTEMARVEYGPGARVSTCFLIDDYFRHDTDPAAVLERVFAAAERCGLRIDYLAREAGCGEMPVFVDGMPVAEPIRLAELISARIVEEPPRATNGSRPPAARSGWLCNGQRAKDEPDQAMRTESYQPPEEAGRRMHSVFLDVEMWRSGAEGKDALGGANTKWACAFLASVWQLLRLGAVRRQGAAVVSPQPPADAGDWPAAWKDLPAVTQLNPAAKPFAAYRALSILPHNYLGVEHAVRVILDHLDLDAEVIDQIHERGAAEHPPVRLSRMVSERLTYVFLDGC